MHEPSEIQRPDLEWSDDTFINFEAALYESNEAETSSVERLERYLASRDALMKHFLDDISGLGESKAANVQDIGGLIEESAANLTAYVQTEPDKSARIELAAACIYRDTIGVIEQCFDERPSHLNIEPNADIVLRESLEELLEDEDDPEDEAVYISGSYTANVTTTLNLISDEIGRENENDRKLIRRERLKQKTREYLSGAAKIALGAAAVATTMHFLNRHNK